jgi:hypothetical protein
MMPVIPDVRLGDAPWLGFPEDALLVFRGVVRLADCDHSGLPW